MKIYIVMLQDISDVISPEILGAFVTLPEAFKCRNDHIMKNWLLDDDEEGDDFTSYSLKDLYLDNGHEAAYISETLIDFGLKSKTQAVEVEES